MPSKVNSQINASILVCIQAITLRLIAYPFWCYLTKILDTQFTEKLMNTQLMKHIALVLPDRSSVLGSSLRFCRLVSSSCLSSPISPSNVINLYIKWFTWQSNISGVFHYMLQIHPISLSVLQYCEIIIICGAKAVVN